MSLSLGKSFDRNYNLRLPFLSGNYNIEIFFNKKSPFLLYGIKPDFSDNNDISNNGIKINMFKNLESSKFCETFINLHNYKNTNLDISNQFDSIKTDYFTDISYILNESITLSKHDINNKDVFDQLNIYGFTLTTYTNEFIFLIAERHNIVKKLNKKIVRTTGIQISTSHSMNILNEYYDEMKNYDKNKIKPYIGDPTKTINISEIENKSDIIKF